MPCAAVFVPTLTGTTARMISRFKPPVWVAALARDSSVCQALQFSYGVWPTQLPEEIENWRDYARSWMEELQVRGQVAMLVAGPSTRNPRASHRLEFLQIE